MLGRKPSTWLRAPRSGYSARSLAAGSRRAGPIRTRPLRRLNTVFTHGASVKGRDASVALDPIPSPQSRRSGRDIRRRSDVIERRHRCGPDARYRFRVKASASRPIEGVLCTLLKPACCDPEGSSPEAMSRVSDIAAGGERRVSGEALRSRTPGTRQRDRAPWGNGPPFAPTDANALRVIEIRLASPDTAIAVSGCGPSGRPRRPCSASRRPPTRVAQLARPPPTAPPQAR